MTNSTQIKWPSRLGAVWLTYRTRWLFILTAVGFLAVLYPAVKFGMAPIDNVTSAAPTAPRPEPHNSVFIRDGGEILGKIHHWEKLKSLTLSNGLSSCEPLWSPGAMPELESLTVYDGIQDHHIAKLCELYDLKALSLFQCQDLTEVAMTHLAAEPKLEYLSLHNFYSNERPAIPGENPQAIAERAEKRSRSLHFAPVLKWPATLRTLDFDDTVGAGDERLSEWQQLPRLHTLITRLYPQTNSRQLSKETLELVRGIPALRRLYLTEAGPHSPRHVEMQQAALPRLSVRPTHFNRTRARRVTIILMGSFIFSLLLAIQMSAQFASSARVLVPGYAKSHLTVTVIGSGLVLLVSMISLMTVGCPVAESLALAGVPIFVLAAGAKVLRNATDFPLPGFTNFGFALPFVVFPLIGIQWLGMLFGGEFAWFLRSQYPWITWGLMAGAIWGGCDILRWHLGLARDLEQGGVGNVPLGLFDIAGWNDWSRDVMALREAKGKKAPPYFRSRDALLDRFIESLHERRPMTSLQLWKLGNFGSVTLFMLVMSKVLFGFGVVGAILMYSKLNPTPLSLPTGANALQVLAPASGQIFFMLLSFVFVIAWQRRPMFTLELLRPLSRRDWRWLWFRGIASEMSVLVPFVLLLCAGLYSLGAFGEATVTQLILGGLAVIGFGLLFAGVGLWSLTITSFLHAVGAGVAALAALITTVVGLAMLADRIGMGDSLTLAAVLVGLLYTVGSAVLIVAWRRWKKFEVGHIL